MKQTSTQADRPDDVLTLLADQHRRSIITYFRESPADDATLTELATHICEQSDERLERVQTRLHHAVLPRLADAGVVEYDERSKTIGYQGTDDVERLMDCPAEL